jgi:ketosteroid isomerase-like protein
MRKVTLLLMATFFSVFLLAFQVTYGQNKNDQNIALIRAARESSNRAIAKHDMDGIARFWHNNFVEISGNSTYLTGKDIIVADWKKFFKKNATETYVRTPSQIVISTNDTLAWETGTWKGFNSSSKGGNYSAMWRKSKNTWKIQAELFVSLF